MADKDSDSKGRNKAGDASVFRPYAMPDWQERYKDKIKTAAQAISTIRRGDKVFIGSGAAEPQTLVRSLIESAGRLADTRIMHIMTLGVAPYTEEKFTDQFRHNAFFIGANTRKAVAEGRADYTPVFLSEIPALFRSGQAPIDVALIQVSLPDRHGFCSYGVSTDVVKSGAESANKVIAEINPQMPRALGDCFISMDDIDIAVEGLEDLADQPDTETAARNAIAVYREARLHAKTAAQEWDAVADEAKRQGVRHRDSEERNAGECHD